MRKEQTGFLLPKGVYAFFVRNANEKGSGIAGRATWRSRLRECIMYIVCGIITARFLEKRKMRAATVAHALLFVLIALLLLFMPASGGIAAFARSLFGGYYEAVREALFAQKEFLGAAVSAALTAEITVVILFLLSLAALFLSVAEPFSSSPAAERVSLHFVHFAKTLRRSYPMWLKFCRLRS